jgi:hypothetical protein
MVDQLPEVTVSGTTAVADESDIGEPGRAAVVVVALLRRVVVAVDVPWCGCAIRTATRLANPPNPAAAATALLRLIVRSLSMGTTLRPLAKDRLRSFWESAVNRIMT